MRYRPQTDKTQLHISFYDDGDQQRIEYIPKDFGSIRQILKNYYFNFMLKHNIQFYYWNIRSLLIAEHRKAEDLRFIHHVKTAHNGKPELWRERLHFKFAWWLYDLEYERFAGEIFDHYENKTPIDDPYVKAYANKWGLKRSAQWQTLYHGVNWHEYRDMLEEVRIDHERYLRKQKEIRKRQSKNRLK